MYRFRFGNQPRSNYATPEPPAGMDFEAVKNFSPLSYVTQEHLKKVYFTLFTALTAAALGVYVDTLYSLAHTFLPVIGMVGCLVWLLVTPPIPRNVSKRWWLFMSVALCNGCMMGPLITMVSVNVSPNVVFTALLCTSAVFACFSSAALLARRREYLFLGAGLSSAVTMLFVMQLGSLFMGGLAVMHKIQLYGGLLVFVGYVVYDTQLIVEKACNGDMDHIKHALELFTDFVAIFTRILIILARSSDRQKREKERRRD